MQFLDTRLTINKADASPSISKVKIPNLTQRLFIATLAMCPYYFSYKSLPIALNLYNVKGSQTEVYSL